MGQNQNQILKMKKKGRPSKVDLADRAVFKKSVSPATENDVRRSLRRRTVRYCLDYDDFFIDDFDGGEEEDDDEEEEQQRRREKKMKFLMQKSKEDDDPESTLSRRRVNYTTHVSPSSSDNNEDHEEEEEEVRCKTERKSYKEGDDSAPDRVPPLPDKKTLELILDKLQKKDIYGVYAEPVDPEELPDYHDVVEFPMDFSTVRKKLSNGSYVALEQFESDVYLICTNAMQYNSADTIYHKQARTIQEMAERKFQRLRMAAERRRCCEKEEVKLLKKKKPLTTVNSSRNLQEAIVGSDFSSGATLATPPPPPPPFDANSLFIDGEDLSGRKAIFSKFGKNSSLQDENRRATYNQHIVKSDSIFSTFESEAKHLVAVGPHTDNSYARSLARFAATLGPIAWKVASKRIEQALPSGSKFGPGWVGEYEPLPNPTILLVEKSPQNCETISPKLKNHITNQAPVSSSLSSSAAVTQLRADHHPQKKPKKTSIEPVKQIQVEQSFKPQTVKIEPENAQKQNKPVNVPSNAAQAAARVWMSVGASVNTNTNQKKNPDSSSFYNNNQQPPPQVSRFRGEFPFPGMMMHFQPSMTGMGNEGQFQSNSSSIRPQMVFPQLITADLSRFQQVQSPRRQKQESFAPDLNISFQSSGSPGQSSSQQQPDLALQL
ncbi:uncharacterized protein LOC124945578 isoform X2 [Impatiens glandulifera]|uniref:uncharacterized protein LOC124945578 isoform X2 n=1 Tax=Impatiens glandulifera TaxID=253017 RepID=UPI001FB0BC9A|nr:uncharacterized protein LOC124945578 isoform X2 [Impatiens glandulifera]